MPTVIATAIKRCKARVAELERQIRPLNAERDQLRQAIETLEALTPHQLATDGTAPTNAHPARSRSSRPRAPKGQNRRLILAAIREHAKTGGEVANETGIPARIAANTLTKLVKDGLAVKAERGYRAADTLLWRTRR